MIFKEITMGIKKNALFQDFLSHPMLKKKYGLKQSDIPTRLDEGLASKHAIIRGLATICDELVDNPDVNTRSLYETMAKRLSRD